MIILKNKHLLVISNSKNMTGQDTSCLGCDAVPLCEYILAFKKTVVPSSSAV
jgi:hypothetical protein